MTNHPTEPTERAPEAWVRLAWAVKRSEGYAAALRREAHEIESRPSPDVLEAVRLANRLRTRADRVGMTHEEMRSQHLCWTCWQPWPCPVNAASRTHLSECGLVNSYTAFCTCDDYSPEI